jgi:hypothetical protein
VDAEPGAEAKKTGKPKVATNARPAAKSKPVKGKKTDSGIRREGTHKAEVIAMLQRKGGATRARVHQHPGEHGRDEGHQHAARVRRRACVRA